MLHKIKKDFKFELTKTKRVKQKSDEQKSELEIIEKLLTLQNYVIKSHHDYYL